jgi:hypothetical protein
VSSIFLEVAMSKKLNFIFQPTIKFAAVNKDLGGANLGNYISAKSVTSNPYNEYLDTVGAKTGVFDIAYNQVYDSMVQTVAFNKSYMEIEIPFLFRYKVDRNFSLIAGMNFIFGKTVGFELGDRKISTNNINDTSFKVKGAAATIPIGRFFEEGISGKSSISSNYNAPISPVRFGYTIGLSYVFNDRILLDLLVQQNLSGTSNFSNVEVRKIFEQPYVRLSLGYTIFGRLKK